MNVQAALIIAIGIALGGLFIGGIYKPIAVGNGDTAGAYMLNRFTGAVFVCSTFSDKNGHFWTNVACGKTGR